MSVRPWSRVPGTILRLVSSKAGAARLLHLGAVFGIAFVFLLATMNRAIGLYDEGVILFGAVRVMSGDVPYRDFYANYGPAQFYALAALFKVFGPSVLVSRIWDLHIRAFSVLVVYLIFVRARAGRLAPVAALLSLVWLAALGFYGYPLFPCLLFSLLSVYCAMPAYRGYHAPLSLVLSGGFVGIVALFRLDSGVMVALAHVAALGLLCLKEGKGAHSGRETFVRSTAALVAGILLVSVPVGSLLLFAVPFQEVLRNLVSIPARIYAPMRSLPFPPLSGLLNNLAHLRLKQVTAYAVYLPLVAVFVGGVVALGRRASDVPKPGAVLEAVSLSRCRRGTTLVLTCLSLVFFFKGIVRVAAIQMAPAIVPALLIACMSWLSASGGRLVRVLALLLTTCVGVVSGGPLRNTVWLLIDNVAWCARVERSEIAGQTAPTRTPCHASDGLERIGCFTLGQDQINAIRYVQERTLGDERIFVGLTRHDKIFINNVLFYFASKRLSATKWHHFDPGVQTTAEIQGEMIAELEAHRPRVVVLDSLGYEEPNSSRLSSGVTLLDDYIRSRYRLGATFGSIQVRLLQP